MGPMTRGYSKRLLRMLRESVCFSYPVKSKAMNGETLTKIVVITNPQGFHMRPVVKFAQIAGRFQSDVKVSRDGHSVNGKSPLEMMTTMLSLPGTELTVEVNGPDARDALDALVAVMESATEDEG